MNHSTEFTAVSVAKGSIYLSLQNIFSTVIAVLGFAFMARMVTADEMGVIAGLTLFTSLFPLLSEFGLNLSILKRVSELSGKGENISSIVVSALSFRTIICLSVASTALIIAPNLSDIIFK